MSDRRFFGVQGIEFFVPQYCCLHPFDISLGKLCALLVCVALNMIPSIFKMTVHERSWNISIFPLVSPSLSRVLL